MKATIEERMIYWFAGIALVSLLLASTAWAGGKKRPPPRSADDVAVTVTADPAVNVSTGDAAADAAAAADSSSSATGGSNGDQISMNSSQFYALSLMFPQAMDCFTGAQGGGQLADADDGASGFLGLHLLNKSCWLQKQASAEQDIELNARLRCGDKHYRNAIAYDVPRSERQATCIRMKIASARAQMDNFEDELAELEASAQRRLEELQACHKRVDEANERTERCFQTIVEGK